MGKPARSFALQPMLLSAKQHRLTQNAVVYGGRSALSGIGSQWLMAPVLHLVRSAHAAGRFAGAASLQLEGPLNVLPCAQVRVRGGL